MMAAQIISLIVLFVLSAHSLGNEPMYEREYSIRNSTHAVIAMKIDGRIGCNTLNSFEKISRDEKCFGSNITEEMALYNLQKNSEDFLVIKPLSGDKKQGDIIKVEFKHNTQDFGHMDIGSVYLIFFHREKDGFYYEYCDVLRYQQVEKFIKNQMSFEKLADTLLAKDLSICPSF
jgi:hypothetical protein